MAEKLLAPLYEQNLKTSFRAVLPNSAEAEFHLIGVEKRPAPNGYESFSLFFSASQNVPPEQATYTLTHASMPQTAIFLVPVEQGPRGLIFQAVFNRQI